MTIGVRWHGARPSLAFTVGRHTWVGIRVALAHWLMRGVAMERNRIHEELVDVRLRVARLEGERLRAPHHE